MIKLTKLGSTRPRKQTIILQTFFSETPFDMPHDFRVISLTRCVRREREWNFCSKQSRQPDLTRISPKPFPLVCGELPSPRIPLWEPRNQTLPSCLMPVSLPFPSLKWVVRWVFSGRGPQLQPSYPRSLLKHALIEKVCNAYCSATTPQLHCNWGIRDWTSGGITHISD